MKPIPIGVVVDGIHITIGEILAWARSRNLLDEDDVRTEAHANWLARKGTAWENIRGDLGDYYRAEKTVALCAFLDTKPPEGFVVHLRGR